MRGLAWLLWGGVAFPEGSGGGEGGGLDAEMRDYIHICVCIYACVLLHAYMYTYIYIHMCIYIYICIDKYVYK